MLDEIEKVRKVLSGDTEASMSIDTLHESHDFEY